MSTEPNELKQIAKGMFADLANKEAPRSGVTDLIYGKQYRTELLTMELCTSHLSALSDMMYALIEEETKYAEDFGGVFPHSPEVARNAQVIRYMANNSYVVFCGEEIVAVASYFSDSKEIGNVYVKPEHRGKGHAKALVTRLLNEYKVERVNVVPTNAPAVGLYKSLGFELYPVNPMLLKK